MMWRMGVSRILYIEDDAETRIAVRKILEASGLTVDTVWNGEKGIEAAMSGAFDCIILDLMMPGMDGFQVMHQLKTQEATRHVPVVVLTAKSDDEIRLQALSAGATAYIQKPFNINDLAQTIQNVTGLKNPTSNN